MDASSGPAGFLRGGYRSFEPVENVPWMISEEEAEIGFKECMQEEPKPGQMRGIWNVYIFSWTSHGEALLEEANNAGVQLILVQEANLGVAGIRGASQWAQRMGWSIRATPKRDGCGRGGTLIALKEPAAFGAADSPTTSSKSIAHGRGRGAITCESKFDGGMTLHWEAT